MSSEFNPERKNPAFLAQLFDETLYNISEPAKDPQQQYAESDNSKTTTEQKDDFAAKEPLGDKTYTEKANSENEDPLKGDATSPDAAIEEEKPKKDLANSGDLLQSSHEIHTGEEEASLQVSSDKLEESNLDRKRATFIDLFGQYQQQIVVLVAYHNQKNLIPKDQMVLEQILNALGISFNEIAVINVEKAQLTFDQIKKELDWQQLIAFGIKPDFIPFNIPQNELKLLDNGEQVLLAPAISEVAASKSLKRKLWQNLKTLFNQ